MLATSERQTRDAFLARQRPTAELSVKLLITLLAAGLLDPHALVASIAELHAVTAAALPLTLHDLHRYLLSAVHAAAVTLLLLSDWVRGGLLRSSAASAAAGAAGTAQALTEEGAAGPAAQLGRLAAWAACAWLPALS